MQRDDERPPGEARDRRGEEPVGVDEVRAARGTPYRSPHREEHERRRPRAAAQVRRHPAAVGEAVVAVAACGREHLDLHPALAQPLDGVGDEAAGELPPGPRPRCREDDDPHYPGLAFARPPKTTGSASAKASMA